MMRTSSSSPSLWATYSCSSLRMSSGTHFAPASRCCRPSGVAWPARSASCSSEPPSRPRQARDTDGRQTTSPEGPTASLRPYNKELEGRLYSVLSRKTGTSRRVAGWACAVCRTAPATVLDHCHEHGYVRAPVCQSCNTQERPDHLYSNDIRVANHYTRLFHTDTDDWLRHWHRCPGCRARTTLPLPHLAAWTAHVACRSLRPTHRAPRGRKPCGVLRVSWTGSQKTPCSCMFTVAVDFCPSGEHRVLARVPHREAAEGFVPGWPRRPLPWPPRPVLTAWTASLPSSGQSSRTPAERT
ncbi:endonuclease domain-containing protein [Streptomyces sp. NPDC127061]|uniref:endonuclease domain-containing protein n=1 Tax=Streptomyces sp. NPDC127061 TaxID=3347122 RepID=UPI003663BD57